MTKAIQITRLVLQITATLAIITIAVLIGVNSARNTSDVMDSYVRTNNTAPLVAKWIDIGVFAILSVVLTWNVAALVWRSRMHREVERHDNEYRSGELGRAKDEIKYLKLEVKRESDLAKDREIRLRNVLALSENWLSMECMEKLRKLAIDPIRNL